MPSAAFRRSSALLSVLGCAWALIGCAQPRTPRDLLDCANGNFASCRAAADRAQRDEADELRTWACAHGDDETCLKQFVVGHACEKTPRLDCPLVRESVGQSGVLANRRCEVGSAAGCAYAFEVGHRSKFVLGTTLVEAAGELVGFLDDEYLLTASAELTLFRLIKGGNGVRDLKRVASRPLLAQMAGNGLPATARVQGFALTPEGRGLAVLDLSSAGRRYLWTLGSGNTPAQLSLGTRFSALTPRGDVLLTATDTSDYARYGVSARAIRLYDPESLQPRSVGVELGVDADRALAADGWCAVLGVDGVHLFDRNLSRHQLLRPRGVQRSFAFTADGRRILITGNEGMDLYELSNLTKPLRSRAGHFVAAAFSPDGTRLAVQTEYGLRLVDGQTLADLSPELEPYYKPERSWIASTHLLFDPSGSTLLVEREDQILVVSLPQANGRTTAVTPTIRDPLGWFERLEPVDLAALYDAKLANSALEGRVLLDEKPVAGARIELTPNVLQLDQPFPEWRAKARESLAAVGSRQATTDDAGRFRFADLPMTPWNFDLQATGLIRKSSTEGVLVPGRPAFDIRMVRCATLEGRVRLPGGAPGAGFKIFISGDEYPRNPPVQVSTDADGRYHVACVRPANRLHVEAVGPNGEAAYRQVDLTIPRAYSLDLSAEPFEAQSLVRLVVTSEDGTPLPNVAVGYAPNDRTGPTGRWSSARSSSPPPIPGTLMMPQRRSPTAPWTVRLPTAELLVRHPKRQGETLTLGRATTAGMEYATATDDPLGTRFSQLFAGRWTLWRVDQSARLGIARVDLAAREMASIEAPAGTVSGLPATGQVFDHDTGKPILGAEVSGSCFNAPSGGAEARPLELRVVETDPAGRFLIPCVSRDLHTFRVVKNGYVDQTLTIDARSSKTPLVIDNVRLRRARPDLIRALIPGL